MKIALLARNPHLYSHRRIVEAARARGHDIEIINTLRVSINITSRKPALYYRKRALDNFDAVIPRIGASVTFYGLAVLRQFEVMGVYPLNESVAIGRSRDKLRCLQLLARRGIGLPVTAFTHDPRQAEDIIDLVGGPPVVIKLLEGTQGIGVVLGETVKSAKSVIEAFQGVNVNILVQQFIEEADSTDIRVLVIGDRVVASMKRQGPPGESARTCIAAARARRCASPRKSEARRSGQRARSVSMSAASICCDRKMARLCSRSTHHPASRGSRRRPIDVATPIIEFLESHAAPNNTRTKGKG
jgi:ribosomal protein S6--L-glutamate ligase